MDQVAIQPKRNMSEVPRSWSSSVSDAASFCSSSVYDALQNPIVDAALLASTVFLASKFRTFGPVEQLLPDLKLVAAKTVAADGMAIAESAVEGGAFATAGKSIVRSRAILSVTETKASLQAAHPGVKLDAMEFPKPDFPNYARRVEELPQPIESFYTKKSFPDGAIQDYKTGSNEGIFDLLTKLKIEQSPAMLYRLRNGTELIVPKEFDAQLSEIRALRLAVAKPNVVRAIFNRENIRLLHPNENDLARVDEFISMNGKPDQTVGELLLNSAWSTENISRALGRGAVPCEFSACKVSDLGEEIVRLRSVMALRRNSLKPTLMPEDVPSLLRVLPDASMVKRVVLLNETSEPYAVEGFSSRPVNMMDSSPIQLSFRAFANRSEGCVTFFKSPGLNVERVVTTAKHEQVHLNHDPAYKIARRLDPQLEASHYGYTNVRESEAELEARAFLSGPVPRFFAAIDQAPLRMSVLANKLTRTIAAAPEGGRPVDADQILARARYIQEQVIPQQSERIAGAISAGKSRNQSELRVLLAALNRDSQQTR